MSVDENNYYDNIPGEKIFSNQSYGYTRAGTGAERAAENPARMSSVSIRVSLLVLSIAIVVVVIAVVIVGVVSGVRDGGLRADIDMLKTSFSGNQQQMTNATGTGTYVHV